MVPKNRRLRAWLLQSGIYVLRPQVRLFYPTLAPVFCANFDSGRFREPEDVHPRLMPG
jgi:hypothetical protein